MFNATTSAAKVFATRATCIAARARAGPMRSSLLPQKFGTDVGSSATNAPDRRIALLRNRPSQSFAFSTTALRSHVVFGGAVTDSATLAAKLGLPEGQEPKWEIRMLYDGDCPLCMREVDMLRDMDKDAGKIDFVDISANDYNPRQNMDLDFATVMKSIHAILPDGTVISGVEVFRRLYEAVGLGWVYAITKNPTIGRIAENVYDFWARNRMAVTGRPELEVILSEKKMCRDIEAESSASKTD